MGPLFRHVTYAEASHFPFLKTLIDEMRGTQLEPRENDIVAVVYATYDSPDEVLIEYGRKNKLGEYLCHANLTASGVLKDRNCFVLKEDGKRSQEAEEAYKKEARAFLAKYRFDPKRPADFKMEPIYVNSAPPMPMGAGALIIQRAHLTFEDTALSD